MAIVYRNGRPRLQHSIRRNGRVTTRYGGSGTLAALVEALEFQDKLIAQEDRQKQDVAFQEITELDQTFTDQHQRVHQALADALVEAGYHRPQRKPWRKQRG